jgi:hypothetical protein
MIPCLVTGDDAVQETVTFTFTVVQQVLTDLHSVVFMFPCQHPWESPGTNFAIFHCCQHHFQRIEANIQFCTQFPGCNPLIRMDELIEALLFCGLTAVQGHPESGLSLTSLLPLLKHATHHLTVLTSTVWTP